MGRNEGAVYFVQKSVNTPLNGCPAEDASLVRRVASALSDPSRQAEARRLLQQRFAEPPKVSLKALLASAPLDGIDLDRSPASGREVDL